MEKVIAYLGLPGSYSHQAGLKYFGKNAKLLSCSSFEEIITSVKEGLATHGIIPVSNTLVGPITNNYKLIDNAALPKIGEIDLPIHHNLVGTSDSSINQILKVYSHPSALAQCKRFLAQHQNIQVINYSDTASAAKYISQMQDPTLAAISSQVAAKIYGLKILYPYIEDNADNTTHFVIITRPDLTLHRVQIDRIDKKIIDLVSQRVSICKEVGLIKNYLGLPILNSAREKAVIKNAQSYSGLDKLFVKKLFSTIISHCRDNQTREEV